MNASVTNAARRPKRYELTVHGARSLPVGVFACRISEAYSVNLRPAVSRPWSRMAVSSFAPARQVLRIGHVRRAHRVEPAAGVDFGALPTIIELLTGY